MDYTPRTAYVSGSAVKALDALTHRDVSPSATEIPDRPYSVRDPDDSFSLINFLSDRLKDAVMALPEEMLLMTEAELKREATPTPTDYSLRVSFWREFERAMWKGSGKIVCAQIFVGICSDTYFYRNFITKPAKFAWMIRPMQVYKKEMEAILYRCTERLWELIEAPIQGKNGKIDPKMAEILLKTITSVENRVKGMAVQRSEQKNVNVNVVTRTKATQDIDTMASLDERIKELQKQMALEGKVVPPPPEATVIGGDAEEREFVDVGSLKSAVPVT